MRPRTSSTRESQRGSKSAIEVASALGADVLFQINSLEKSQKTLGKDARWERKYFVSNPQALPVEAFPLNDENRAFIRQRFLSDVEAKYRALMPDSKLAGRRIEEILGVIHGFERVKSVSDVLKEGDEVLVKVVSIDKTGKIRLSRKEAMAERAAGQQQAADGLPAQSQPATQPDAKA